MNAARGLLAGCAAWLALAGAAADPAAERASIDAERHQLQSRFAAEEAACQHEFAVTACVDAVKARRREALGALRERELRLDDAERRQRAEARAKAIEGKRIATESRPPARPASASAPVVRTRPPPAASQPARAAKPAYDDTEAQAAARRAAAERRREAAAAERAKIAEREAQQAQNPKRAQPLPLPPELQASGVSR